MIIVLIAVLALPPTQGATPTTRASFFYTGKQLKNTCAKDDDLSLGLCVGYIDSVLDGMFFRDTYLKTDRLCMTSQASNADLRKSVLAELNGNTDGLGLPAFTYVERTVTAQWSCSSKAVTK